MNALTQTAERMPGPTGKPMAATAVATPTEARIKLSPTSHRFAFLCLAAVAATAFVGACILNPQPLPPEAASSEDPGDGNGSSSSGTTGPVSPGLDAGGKGGDAAPVHDAAPIIDAARIDAAPDAGPTDAGDAGG